MSLDTLVVSALESTLGQGIPHNPEGTPVLPRAVAQSRHLVHGNAARIGDHQGQRTGGGLVELQRQSLSCRRVLMPLVILLD